MCLSHTTKLKNLSLLSHSLSLSQTHTRIKTDCITNNCKGEPVKMIHKEATPFARSADKNLTSISVIYGSKNEAFFEAFLGNELG